MKFISSEQDIRSQQNSEFVFIDEKGNVCDQTKSIVKKISREKGPAYFIQKNIKTDKLFNPLNDSLNETVSISGKFREKAFSFQRVSEETYNLYMEFLNSRRKFMYKRAQRSMKDDQTR